MNTLFTHKLSGQQMRIKKLGDVVSTLYVLDSEGEIISDGYDVKGNPCFKTAVCSNDNLITN